MPTPEQTIKNTARHKKWIAENRARWNEYQRQRWAAKTDEQRIQHNVTSRKSWKKRTPEQQARTAKLSKSSLARRLEADPNHLKEIQRRYANKHREERRKRERARRLENPQKQRDAHKRWRSKNGWRLNLNRAKYRALKVSATVNLCGIREFVRAIKSKASALCYYCARRVPIREIHFDHIIPLSKGGAHSVENLCVSCVSCNCSKHDKSLSEWAKSNLAQQILPL